MKKIHEEITEHSTKKGTMEIKRYYYDFTCSDTITIELVEKNRDQEKIISITRIPIKNTSQIIKNIMNCLYE